MKRGGRGFGVHGDRKGQSKGDARVLAGREVADLLKNGDESSARLRV